MMSDIVHYLLTPLLPRDKDCPIAGGAGSMSHELKQASWPRHRLKWRSPVAIELCFQCIRSWRDQDRHHSTMSTTLIQPSPMSAKLVVGLLGSVTSVTSALFGTSGAQIPVSPSLDLDAPMLACAPIFGRHGQDALERTERTERNFDDFWCFECWEDAALQGC